MERKQRIPVPDAIQAEVMFSSDHTCCVCRKPKKPVQIHHIDENPANNYIANLAVLCLECHDNTQVRGGFAKKYSASEITRYRDDWLAQVKRIRAAQGVEVVKFLDPEELRLRREQAQQQAAKMRGLYQEFFTALTHISQYAQLLEQVPVEQALDEYQVQYKPLLDEANKVIARIFPELRVEPGADEVCDCYEAFRGTVNLYLQTLRKRRTKLSFWEKLRMTTSIFDVRNTLRAVQDAIRDHIAELDGTTQS